MIYELDTTDYAKVHPLFAALNYQPFCTAALAGLFPGRVVVDDPDHPQAAFVSTEGVWCFLAGKPDDDGFNRALNRALFDREIINGDIGTVVSIDKGAASWRTIGRPMFRTGSHCGIWTRRS